MPSLTNSLGLLTAGTLFAACAVAAEPPDGGAQVRPEAGIAWKQAANDADVDAAFAQARQAQKPVFVYWGAKWCPPCNQVKATLFNRQDFIERSRAFVPVYVDGDSPGAQKLGTRFKVRGYPTMVLFTPQGTELTRLPGEVDAEQYTQVLTLGMNAQRPVKAVLADALAGGEPASRLSANDWKLLAFYSWETDEQQVVPKDGVPTLLRKLADRCPADQAETATRLLLKAVAAAGTPAAAPPGSKPAAKPVTAPATPPAAPPATFPDAAARDKLLQLLADPARPRVHMDVLTNNAADLVHALSAARTPERAQLVAALNTALKRLAADSTLSRADRMTAVIAQVDLAKLGADRGAPPPQAAKNAKEVKVVLPAALLAEVRDHTARADREITDGYERQAVITTAAYMLEQAGLLDESDTLLKANLAKSHSPYYLMSDLASNAKKRGDKAGALRWYEEAFNKSEGPATRLQWGASYVSALVELAPQDEARVEKAAGQVLAEAAGQPNAFYERSARSLQRVGSRLMGWNEGGKHAGVLTRLQAQLNTVCLRLDAADPQRGVCDGLLRPAPKKAA